MTIMAKTSASDLTKEFAVVLKCGEKFVQTRLIVLGHGQTCGRCGGGGHYSYCQMYGTTCFGCSGKGVVAVKLTKSLLDTVKAQVSNGELDDYIAQLRAYAERKAKVKSLPDKIMSAWSSLPSVASEKGKYFMDCSERHHQINAFCCPLSQEADRLADLVIKGEWSKEHRRYVHVDAERQESAIARMNEILVLVQNAEELVK